jgi:hypothetical protein
MIGLWDNPSFNSRDEIESESPKIKKKPAPKRGGLKCL